MILLNSNYDNLYKELKKLSKKLHESSDPNEISLILVTYDALRLFYCYCTGIYVEELNDNKYRDSFNKRLEENDRNSKFNFLINKDFHLRTFKSFYSELSEIVDDFCDSKYYDLLTRKRKDRFNKYKDQDLDILLNFFNEIDPSVKEIYLDMLKKGRIYKLGTECDGVGFTYFNAIHSLPNVFLKPKAPTVDYLSTHTHEIGHVVDDLDLVSTFSKISYKDYIFKSQYSEVLSTLYQQKFHEFLFNNNISREDCIYDLVNFYYSYLEEIENLILIASLPNDCYDDVMQKKYTREQLSRYASGDISFPDESIPDLFDALEYSYGILVANDIMDDKTKLDKFLTIRKGFFDSKKLESIGFVPEEAGKKLIKNLTSYIK